jgi:lactoylglutathione lyase
MKKKLLPLLAFAALFLMAPSAFGQSPSFNHLTVYVTDLKKSGDFYEKVMMLKRIPEPFKDGKHDWFKITEHGQLHVVSGATAIVPHDINIHLSFTVVSLPDFMKHLDELNIKYGNWKGDSKTPQLRPDGVKQVYFQDPDGYWIEVNDDKF